MGFYTYLWLRYDGTPYYVGKGKDVRAFRRGCPPLDRVIIQEHPSEEDAFVVEKFLISYYGRIDLNTGCLRNRTDGGEGYTGKSPEARQRLSDVNKGNQNARGNRGGRYVRNSGHIELAIAQCLRMSILNKGNRYSVGMRHSSDTIKKRLDSIRDSDGGFSKLIVASAKGKHSRWHAKRGLIVSGCPWCEGNLVVINR